MRVRRVDRNNDWTFGLQDSGYAKGSNAVALDIKLKLQEWLGDCFFALQNGIPWNVRLGSRNQKELLDTDIYNTAMKVIGVLDIADFQSQVTNYGYNSRFNVLQEYSDGELSIDFIMGV